MINLAAYQGREVDIAFLVGDLESSQEIELQQTLRQDDGLFVTGIASLAQRVLWELLTEQGSQVYRPLRGTGFMTAAKQGFWRTTVDVAQSFYLALRTLKQNVWEDETEEDPPDSRLDDLSLLNVTLANGTVDLRLQLISRDGTAAELLLPINVTTFSS